MFEGVLAVLFGLITLGFGVVLVLRPISQGFLIAPIGAGGIGVGLHALRQGDLSGTARVLALLGLVTGLVGAVLIVIGLARSALSF
jgi:hypothetical protein